MPICVCILISHGTRSEIVSSMETFRPPAPLKMSTWATWMINGNLDLKNSTEPVVHAAWKTQLILPNKLKDIGAVSKE